MLFIPLPFVIALMMLLLFVMVIRRDDEAPPNQPFLALIMISAFQSVLSGLRWGYGIQGVGYIAPVVAALVPPLVHAGVLQLVSRQPHAWLFRSGLHAIPAITIIILILTRREIVDIALFAIFTGYAAAILRLLWQGTDGLRLAPFEGATSAYRAIIFAASALCLSALVDVFIFLDFAWAHGEHAIKVISIGNLTALLVMGIAAAAASRSHAPAEISEPAPKRETLEDKETIERIHTLMDSKKVYRDANLNLDRLSRRAGIPARQISGAINRATARNVSQYVNEYRIAEACNLLVGTDKSVTEIMFEVGFQTKSNFNREFRRITDMSPLDWREKNRQGE